MGVTGVPEVGSQKQIRQQEAALGDTSHEVESSAAKKLMQQKKTKKKTLSSKPGLKTSTTKATAKARAQSRP